MLLFFGLSWARATRLLVSMTLFLFVSAAYAAPKAAKLIKFWDDREPSSAIQVNHDSWQNILNLYVDDQHASGINRFDYEAVTAGDALKIKSYLDYLQKMEPRQLNSLEAQAFWINLYNALMVDKIVDAYQSGSSRAVNRLLRGGLRSTRWNRNVAEVVFQELSLDDIVHGILRPIWKDPRINFVLATGALSGANMLKTAFDGDNNEVLLEQAKNDFFAHPKAVRVEDGRIVLNSIFDWYAEDFAPNKSALLQYIQENVPEPTRQSMLTVSRTGFDYTWDLNAPDTQFQLVANIDDDE